MEGFSGNLSLDTIGILALKELIISTVIGWYIHNGLDNGAYINLLVDLGGYTKKYFNCLNVKFVRRYLYDSVHEVCLGKGVLSGGDLVEYLVQDDTPLHFLGNALNGKKSEDLFLKDVTIPDPSSTEKF